MLCRFPADPVRSAADARAAAVAASRWRRSTFPQTAPVIRPAPPAATPELPQPTFAPADHTKRVLVSDVIHAAVVCFGISRADLLGHSHKQKFVLPRHAAIVVAIRMTGRSLLQLGKQFGGRDHTSILHAREKFRTHHELQMAVAKLTAALTTPAAPPEEERSNG